MTGAEALVTAARELKTAGIDDPARDARRLLAHAIGCRPDRLSLHLAEPLSEATEATFTDLICRRVARQPVSQLTGGRYFFDHWFTVTPDVLDPRPETEGLVRQALDEPFSKVLDLGTGSGAILLSLLAARGQVLGLGTDISDKALAVAAGNAAALGLNDRVRWQGTDWYAGISEKFDLIVSNPPYIAVAEMPGLVPEVRDHEPRFALTDEADGLSAYRAIATGAQAHMTSAGRILVEIGETQGTAITAIFRQAGLADIRLHHDLDGRDRVVSARNPG